MTPSKLLGSRSHSLFSETLQNQLKASLLIMCISTSDTLIEIRRGLLRSASRVSRLHCERLLGNTLAKHTKGSQGIVGGRVSTSRRPRRIWRISPVLPTVICGCSLKPPKHSPTPNREKPISTFHADGYLGLDSSASACCLILHNPQSAFPVRRLIPFIHIDGYGSGLVILEGRSRRGLRCIQGSCMEALRSLWPSTIFYTHAGCENAPHSIMTQAHMVNTSILLLCVSYCLLFRRLIFCSSACPTAE